MADPTLPPSAPDPDEQAYDLSRWAVHYAERWEWSKASEAMEKAVLLSPTSWTALGSVFRRLQQTGRMQDGVQLLRDTLKTSPDAAPELWNALGCFELELKHHQAALEACRRAVTAEPPRAAFVANLGVVLEAAGKPAEAAKCFEMARLLMPADRRIERLALLARAGQDAMGLLFLSGHPKGQILPALAHTDETFSTGHEIQLQSDHEGTWTLTALPGPDAALLFRMGAPVIASLWNPAGLILKMGHIERVAAHGDHLEIEVKGPEARRVQRRRHLRVLAPEEFVRADQLEAGGKLTRRDLVDLSASGLSYLATGAPPEGSAAEFRLHFRQEDITAPGVVRSARGEAPRVKVGVEFLAGEKAADRIARLIHERQRSLHAPTVRSAHH